MAALRATPEGDSLRASTQSEPRSNQAQTARIILSSQAAAENALQKSSDQNPSPEAAQSLLSQLQIVCPDSTTLTLTLQSRTAARAKDSLSGLLDYYQTFTSKNCLTRIKKTRQKVEVRLTKVRQTLSKLEEQLSQSQASDLRRLGDATLKVNPKVLHQIWLRRADEEGKARALLQQMQKLRAHKDLENPDEKWLAEWAAGRKTGIRYAKDLLGRPASRQELLQRAQLERNYYEALLLHRSLTLQQSFLLTWEELETAEFEVLDPISVKRLRSSPLGYALLGAVLGALLALGWGGQTRRAPTGG